MKGFHLKDKSIGCGDRVGHVKITLKWFTGEWREMR
jgi:hypothetical protein